VPQCLQKITPPFVSTRYSISVLPSFGASRSSVIPLVRKIVRASRTSSAVRSLSLVSISPFANNEKGSSLGNHRRLPSLPTIGSPLPTSWVTMSSCFCVSRVASSIVDNGMVVSRKWRNQNGITLNDMRKNEKKTTHSTDSPENEVNWATTENGIKRRLPIQMADFSRCQRVPFCQRERCPWRNFLGDLWIRIASSPTVISPPVVRIVPHPCAIYTIFYYSN
jgi:hypothetical protein